MKVDTPQITSTIGSFGIFNQFIIVFGKLSLSEVLPKIQAMTVEEILFAFGPIAFYIWCILFDEKKHFKG